MARNAMPPAQVIDTPMNETLLAEDGQALNQLAVVTREADERVHALALKLKYDGSTDPAVLENSARDAIQRIGMGIFELGGYLLLMKEACAHGKFLPALERLGLEPPVAQRYMRITARFSNTTSKSHLEALGKTKLLEMMVLDDEQLDELTTLGQTGELALDDVATMSVKELRSALREAKKEAVAKDQVLADKNASMDKLRAQVKRVQAAVPDEELADILRETAGFFHASMGAVEGNLRQAFVKLTDHHAAHGGDSKQVMAGYLGQLQTMINQLREEFMLPDTVGDGTPEWQRWADAQDAAEGTDTAH